MPAPVFSRSSLTRAAVISAMSASSEQIPPAYQRGREKMLVTIKNLAC
jgi:hypothetical protein